MFYVVDGGTVLVQQNYSTFVLEIWKFAKVVERNPSSSPNPNPTNSNPTNPNSNISFSLTLGLSATFVNFLL